MAALPSSRRMTDEVFTILRGRIVAGTLPPGARMDATALAAELGISRTPVREAMLQLEASGLVTRQPYRGTVVTGVDAGRLEEITALRIDLEGRAAALGTPRLSEADLARMAGILDALDAKTADPDFSHGVFNDLNRDFHAVLYAAADAPSLLAIIASLGAEADRARLHFDMRTDTGEPLAQAQHREILDACRRRDAVAVALATRQHLLESYFGMRGDREVQPGILADVLRDLRVEVTP